MPFAEKPLPQSGYVGISQYDAPDPSFTETLGASFARENLIGSTLTSKTRSTPDFDKIDQNYNPFDGLEKDYIGLEDRFLEVYNPKAAAAVKADIDSERKRDEIRARSGASGFFTDILATALDPTILLPGGALVRAGRVVYSTARSAGSVAVAAGAGTAVQEAGLQATQQLRTGTESALNIGGSVVLGGILGAAGSKFFSAQDWGKFSKALEADLQDTTPNAGDVAQTIVDRMQSLGAASVDDLNLDDLGVGGPRAAQAIANATAAIRLNPGLQMMNAKSKEARSVYAQLVDNPVYNRMNMEGETLGPDAENLIKIYKGTLADVLRTEKEIYKSARKEGMSLTKKQFSEAVSRSLRRGDIDSTNPYVAQAAEYYRAKLFNPMLKEAQSVGLLPENIKTDTAASYLYRMWNRNAILADYDNFRATVKSYLQGQFTKALDKQEDIKLAKKIIDAERLGEKVDNARVRLSRVEQGLQERGSQRSSRLNALTRKERERYNALQGRVPADVIDAARNARSDNSIYEVVTEARRKRETGKKKPVIGILKQLGGVRIDSPLYKELQFAGVTQKNTPALYRKGQGLRSADTIPVQDYPILSQLDVDANGFVDPDEIVNAIRKEMAGQPLRTDDESVQEMLKEQAEENARQWLESVGLPETATVKEVRDYFNQALKNEKAIPELDATIAKMSEELEDFDKITDTLKQDKLVAESETAKFEKEMIDLENSINEVRQYVNANPRIKIIVDYADARKTLGKLRLKKSQIEAELSRLKTVPDAKRTPEIDARIRKLSLDNAEADTRVLKGEAKVQKLQAMQPKEFTEALDFVTEQDFDDYVEDVVTQTINNILGRGDGDVPDWAVAASQGPLKGRVFKIPDVDVEAYLENDLNVIARNYVRQVGAEVELTRKFGRADMKEQIERIRNEYDELIKSAQTPEEKSALVNESGRVERIASSLRDLVRGTYRTEEQNSSWGKLTRGALTYNYVRLLGGVTITSLTDAGRHLAVHGIKATFSEGLPGLVSGSRAAQISRQDARDLGAVAEVVLQDRLATLMDLNDPYRSGSRYEKFLSNTANIFTKATGLAYWNDINKTIASVMTQNRIIRNSLSGGYAGINKFERNYMAYLGISEDMAERIARQYQKHGVQENGIYGANVSKWDDAAAKKVYGAALNKDVDRTIITKGAADQPLWTRSNWGKLIMQFKSFGLASHQRILIAGLQERPERFASQIAFSTAIGMMIAYLKFIERGDTDRADNLLENPGLWVADGLDRTGIFSVLFDVSNTADKVSASYGGPTVGIAGIAQSVAGDPSRDGGVSRYASRNALGAILGPTAGLFEDLSNIAATLGKGDMTKSSANASIRMVPGGSLPGIKSALHIGVKPELQESVDD